MRAASGALRNLAVDARNKELIGKELAVNRHPASGRAPFIQQVLSLFVETAEEESWSSIV